MQNNKTYRLPDGKLTYWYNWDILGPDGKLMISLKGKIPPLEKGRLLDIEYLRGYMAYYPEAILLHRDFWYAVAVLRQKSLKHKESARLLKEICKLIVGDGRRRKNQDTFDSLKEDILYDIDYFKEMLELTKGVTIDKAYIKFIRGDVAEDNSQKANLSQRQLAEFSKYRDIYYKYKKIYSKLRDKLTEIETFYFLEKAAENIDKTNVTIESKPDGKLLTFVKVKTWYVKGADIHFENNLPNDELNK